MLRRCDSCGAPYEAKRKNSRFCSTKCRVRASRAPKTATVTLIAAGGSAAPDADERPALIQVVERDLDAAGVLDTILGRQALVVAARICSAIESGSAVASLSRELRAVMAEAMKDASIAGDPLDELRARRDRKRSGDAG